MFLKHLMKPIIYFKSGIRWCLSRIGCCLNFDIPPWFIDMVQDLAKYLGYFLFCFVHILIGMAIAIIFTIIIPYELLYKPRWIIYVLIPFALYLIIQIFFNYYMAVFTKPGNPPKCNLSPRCRKCNSYKPVGTHHCSMCNNCILNMDHHCVWINQCVGDRNHRFFLLFLVFLWTGCFTIVCFGTNTFWNHIWPSNRSYSFCQRTSELNYLPWYQYMCADNGTFTSSCAIFGYLLAVNILILVGFLGGWNILLVSADITQLDFLQQDGLSCMTMRSKITTAIRNNPNVKETWKKFLGLNIRSRSIVTHILFPSRHISSRFDPGEIEHLLSNEQIV